MAQRQGTTTSNFGVGARENHDSTPFYERFCAPELSDDDTVLPPVPVAEPFVCGDARAMDTVVSGSVALVVTSPPYFAGKQYEEELEREGIPASYLEYLEMLRDVFAECKRTLEPGGRIAVNVANLGRKPYRSLAADVIRILEDDLGLLLRGELVWRKGEGASGSCAWGSFRSPANPVLRDITERVIVASKGRFDRARSARRRAGEGLPHVSTTTADEFMALTLDVWSLPTESARRVGHPAPFPVLLPDQLIRLYTYEDDLVLDPFMGSGSTLVAAARLNRRFVGYDLDPQYVELARQRVAEAQAESGPEPAALHEGVAAPRLAHLVLAEAGFAITGEQVKVRRTGAAIALVAEDQRGEPWWFDVVGPYTRPRGGMARSETVWRALGRAAALRRARNGAPYLLLTTELPKRGSEADLALRAAGPEVCFDVVDLTDPAARARLVAYAAGGVPPRPAPGFWSTADLAPRD